MRQASLSPGPKSGSSANQTPSKADTTATNTTVSNMFVTGAQPVMYTRSPNP